MFIRHEQLAMMIGVLSDSHGRVNTTRAAVKLLIDGGAELLIHLGDLGSEEVIDELIGHNARIVLGNCDGDEAGLIRHAHCMGVIVDHPMGLLDIEGKRIAFTHGHLPDLMHKALADRVDYLLHGHTHEVHDERCGATRIINPGALQRAARYTAALLDPAADVLHIREVPRQA
jgi:putative phosphoesterase